MKFIMDLVQRRYKIITGQRTNPRDHINKNVGEKKKVLKPDHGFTWDEKDADEPDEC